MCPRSLLILLLLWLATPFASAQAGLTIGAVPEATPGLTSVEQARQLSVTLGKALGEEVDLRVFNSHEELDQWLVKFSMIDLAIYDAASLSERPGRYLVIGSVDKSGKLFIVSRQGVLGNLPQRVASALRQPLIQAGERPATKVEKGSSLTRAEPVTPRSKATIPAAAPVVVPAPEIHPAPGRTPALSPLSPESLAGIQREPLPPAIDQPSVAAPEPVPKATHPPSMQEMPAKPSPVSKPRWEPPPTVPPPPLIFPELPAGIDPSVALPPSGGAKDSSKKSPGALPRAGEAAAQSAIPPKPETPAPTEPPQTEPVAPVEPVAATKPAEPVPAPETAAEPIPVAAEPPPRPETPAPAEAVAKVEPAPTPEPVAAAKPAEPAPTPEPAAKPLPAAAESPVRTVSVVRPQPAGVAGTSAGEPPPPRQADVTREVPAVIAQPDIPQELRPPGVPVLRPSKLPAAPPPKEELKDVLTAKLPEKIGRTQKQAPLLPPPDPEPGIVYVVPFITLMVPEAVRERIFDQFVDLLNASGANRKLRFVILKESLEKIDREWLNARKYVYGEVFGYVEDSSCCSTDLRAKARLTYYRAHQPEPSLRFEYPIRTFFDHNKTSIDAERQRLADQIANALVAELTKALQK